MLIQSETIGASDVDLSDELVHIRFSITPILQNPAHVAQQQPYIFVEVDNVTLGTQIFHEFFASGQLSQPWQSINGGSGTEIDYLPLQIIDIAPGNLAIEMGDQVTVTIVAAGCSLGGHEGYAYIDNAAGLDVDAVATASTASTITYAFSAENLAAAALAGVSIAVTSPLDNAGTPLPYQSVNAAGLVCASPTQGIAGTIVCTFPTPIAAGVLTKAFEATFELPANPVSPITLGDYTVKAVSLAPVLGTPLINYLQTITFPNPGPQTYNNGGAFALGATASSGLAVSYASNTAAICTVSGSAVTIVGTGNCSITASQSGNGDFVAAPPVTDQLTISLGFQSITFPDPGIQIYSPNGSFMLNATASSGLSVSYASNSNGICTVAGAVVSILNSGTCSITASQPGDSNYNAATPIIYDIPILPAAQSISFTTTPPVDGFVNGPTYAVAAKADSGLPVTLVIDAGSAGVCSLNAGQVSFLAVGNCMIDASQAGGSGYAIATPAQQQITVTFGAPSELIFNVQPNDIQAGSSLGTMVVMEKDAYGNVIDDSATMSFTIAGCGIANEVGSVPMIHGVATLVSTTRLYVSAVGETVTATTGTLTTNSNGFSVSMNADLLFNGAFEACRF